MNQKLSNQNVCTPDVRAALPRKKPKLGSVEMRKRRKERRELAADLRAGVLPLPPPVVGYDVQVRRNRLFLAWRERSPRPSQEPFGVRGGVFNSF